MSVRMLIVVPSFEQFAMGTIYSQYVLGIPEPKWTLNIGEEASKGND